MAGPPHNLKQAWRDYRQHHPRTRTRMRGGAGQCLARNFEILCTYCLYLTSENSDPYE